MRFGLLGELEVESGGHAIRVRGRRVRPLLACLLVHRNQTLSRERLIDALWGARPPPSASHGLEVLVSQLRHQLGPEDGARIETTSGGYRLHVAPEEFDLDRFERLSVAGRRSLDGGDDEAAVEQLREALAEWRGEAFGDLVYEPCLSVEASRIEEVRLDALEAMFEAELRCDRAQAVVSEIEAFVAANPLREHARAQLMRALYRCGRQAEALAAYRDGRRLLVDELGLEPGLELQELEQEILRQEPQLESSPSAPAPNVDGPPHKWRKIVTVLSFDVTGPTTPGRSSDPEVFQGQLARRLESVQGIVERHGGALEKFVGEAAVAVFGVPVVHEDDALRACRAALEMRSALPELGIEARIGLMTGEALTGTEEQLATGDVVGVAGRLREKAGPGEVLIGEATRALVQDAAEVEAVRPLDSTGRCEPAAASRLLGLTDARPRGRESPFVGRERELALLRQAWERAQIEQRCELVTIVGAAGLGKSRLAAEFERTLDARALYGRCPAYGEGITYWPLREIVYGLCQGEDLATELAAHLAPEEHAGRIAGLILGAIGAADAPGASVEEVQWAVRRLFEALAAERPLVVVLDDLHRAEPAFLQLVEYVAECTTAAPFLLLATAREELLDTSPAWALPHPHGSLFALEPLADPDAGRLVQALTSVHPVGEQMRTRLVATGGGNPLFLEQLVALLQAGNGGPEGGLPLPTTITALLAARLDRLPTPERDVLERAAVEGFAFHRGPLTALLPDHEANGVGALLLDAVRRNLIRSCPSRLPGDDGYEFVHVLVRDAVYQSMPKKLRAQLHEQFADWLEQTPAARDGGLQEILGFHLERACRLQAELGRPDPALARRAGERLRSAGYHAIGLGDWWAGRVLLERAVALDERPDVHLLADLAQCLRLVGEPRAAASLLDGAVARLEEEEDAAGAALARALASAARLESGEGSADAAEHLFLAAVPMLEAAGDHAGLSSIWINLAFGVYNVRAQFGRSEHAAEQAFEHTRLLGRPPLVRAGLLGGCFVVGPRPAGEALARLDAIAADPLSYDEKIQRAILLAMTDRLEEARTLAAAAATQLHEFGRPFFPYPWNATFDAICGDDAAAAEHLREVCDAYADHGRMGFLTRFVPIRGRHLCALGRYEEAEGLARRGRELSIDDDALTQALWRQVAALVAAHRGEHGEAERLAREAVAVIQETDALLRQGDAFVDLAEVLEAAGRTDEAVVALEQALDRYERKQIVPLARRTRERLAALRPA